MLKSLGDAIAAWNEWTENKLVLNKTVTASNCLIAPEAQFSKSRFPKQWRNRIDPALQYRPTHRQDAPHTSKKSGSCPLAISVFILVA
ncbi:hypothetical protein B1748_04885 [Paenibacillus sp. MY03]|uniref:hypothetical protein n=1 Tax=Paenibacillus sp. MY03 TaxID=302980 RepID=UPI000B54CAE3|nr:hypothetical protein [Paenibacillus sp. MY03]OUS78103.1 hypothetical protein B1748_04885 [Paenibacillus sp. MY03]